MIYIYWYICLASLPLIHQFFWGRLLLYLVKMRFQSPRFLWQPQINESLGPQSTTTAGCPQAIPTTSGSLGTSWGLMGYHICMLLWTLGAWNHQPLLRNGTWDANLQHAIPCIWITSKCTKHKWHGFGSQPEPSFRGNHSPRKPYDPPISALTSSPEWRSWPTPRNWWWWFHLTARNVARYHWCGNTTSEFAPQVLYVGLWAQKIAPLIFWSYKPT